MVKRTAESRSLGGDRGKQVEPPGPVPSAGKPGAPSPPTEALALFQRGMEALQRHDYSGAATAFDAVVLGFPHERGLLDRAKVYLGLCARESARRPPAPKTIEERLTAATAALNNADDAAAEELARSVLGDDPKHDLALYLLAAVFARRGSTSDALDFLGRAITLCPEASTQARTDDDFTSLHEEEAFWTLTEPPIVPPGTRRRRARG
jgi:tetratricopeptide (TPR) repeat protein